MVRICLLDAQPRLSPFTLSQSLASAIHVISISLPAHRSKVIYDPSSLNSAPIFVLVTKTERIEYCLEFDPVSQLLVSASYHVPDSPDCLYVAGPPDECLQYPISVDDVKRVCGNPLCCHGDGNESLALLYKGSCFAFEKQNGHLCLAKIKMSLTGLPDHVTQTPQTQLIIDTTTCRVTGLSIATPTSGDSKESINIYFGDHHEDILTKLGSASEVFYKSNDSPLHSIPLDRPSALLLSYVQFGVDVLIDLRTNNVSKFVLHTNVPDHHEFCHYSRCFFKFSVTKNSLCTSYESCDNLLVTPTTNWAVLKSHIDNDQLKCIGTLQFAPSTNCMYPFPNTTLYVLFDHMIFETTNTGDIATITLLSHDNHVMLANSYKPHSLVEQSMSQYKEVKFSVQKRVPLAKKGSNSEDEFYDCQEDSFKSAQSSLRSQADLEGHSQTELKSLESVPESQNDQKSESVIVTVDHAALVGPNANVLVGQSDTKVTHTPDPECLVYEFFDSPHTHTDHTPHIHIDHTPHTRPDTIVYQSDSLKITASALDHEDLELVDEEDLHSFEMVSLGDITSDDVESQSTPEVTPGDIAMATEEEEPEFVYQPKATNTGNSSMVSSRTLTFTHERGVSVQRKEVRNRLLTHTRSSQQRVREKYVRAVATPSQGEEVRNEEGGSPSQDAPSGATEGEPPSKGLASSDNEREAPSEHCQHSPSTVDDLLVSPEAHTSNTDPPTDLNTTENNNLSAVDSNNTQTEPTDSNDDLSDYPIAKRHPIVQVVCGPSSTDAVPGELSQTGSMLSDDLPPGLLHSEVGVARKQWDEGGEFIPETGPPSVTQESVLEELISCEHREVCDILQLRLQDLHTVKELLHSPDKQDELEELFTRDKSLAISVIVSLNQKNGWTLSYSAMLLPWIQQLFTSDNQPRCLLPALLAVLCIAENHTTLLLRHTIGRARSLSVRERKQCTKCYTTLEKIDESADILITSLSNRHLTEEERELLAKLREVRAALARIFKKLDYA